MWIVVFGLIFGFLGAFILGQLGETWIAVGGIIGFFSPAFYVLSKIYDKVMNDEDNKEPTEA